jgi:hypothetical protein
MGLIAMAGQVALTSQLTLAGSCMRRRIWWALMVFLCWGAIGCRGNGACVRRSAGLGGMIKRYAEGGGRGGRKYTL